MKRALILCLLLTGCGGSECNKKIQAINYCGWNSALGCQACTVVYEDSTQAVVCQPLKNSCDE